MGNYDFSTLSDEDLAESLAYMNGLYIERFRSDDEGTNLDSSTAKAFHEQYSALKEECARRGVSANRGKMDERIARVRRQLYLLKTIPHWAHEDPSNIFDSERNLLAHDSTLRLQVGQEVKYAGRKRFQEYINSIRSGKKDVEIKLLGRTYTPGTDWSVIYACLRPNTLAITLGLFDDKTEREIRTSIESAYLSSSYRIFFERIAGNIFWMSGAEIVREYVKGVNYLIEKNMSPPPFPDRDLTLAEHLVTKIVADFEGRKPEGLLANILNYDNVDSINDSFQKPVFLNYLYEDRLPAYSWSATTGLPMQQAIRSGEYGRSYHAERKLIRKTVGEIEKRAYSAHPLGK